MKVEELRVLEVDELDMRMKTARRELYELRFKHAVGQLENTVQISRVRHDIARIMTVLRERDLGIVAMVAPEAEGIDQGTPEPVVEVAAAPAEEPARPKRSRRKTEDKT